MSHPETNQTAKGTLPTPLQSVGNVPGLYPYPHPPGSTSPFIRFILRASD